MGTQPPKRHTIRSCAQLSAYTQGVDDCEELISGLESDGLKTYTSDELYEIFSTRKDKQIELARKSPALLRTLAQQEKKREERRNFITVHDSIVKLATHTNITAFRTEEKFLEKLFYLGSESTNRLYGQYENMQHNKNILAIIYLAAPYNTYIIFNTYNDHITRYKLSERNKKTEKQKPNYFIDEHVHLRINNEAFLHKMHQQYNGSLSK